MKYLIKNGAIDIGTDTILDDINFEICDNNHIGIVGRNGSGKTSLLKALIDNDLLSEGIEDIPLTIEKVGKFSLGYLEQISFDNVDNTLIEEIQKSFRELINLEIKIDKLLKEMTENYSENIIEEYTKLNDLYTNLGGYTYKKEYEIMLKKFGFNENDKNKKISSFSGGEKTKIAFIKLLLSKPDILILDEPTNHLDISSIIWLENYLKNYKGAFIIVSHDRMFLNNTVNIIYDVSYKKVTRYVGNYENYEILKQQRYEKQLNDYEKQQKEIARLRNLYEKFRNKPTKAKMALSKLHMIERMDLVEKPMAINKKTFKTNLSKIEPSGKNVLSLKNLIIGYDKEIININLEVIKGQKIGIIGPNGTGKSTLLKTLYGLIKPLSGHVSYGYNVNIGYFDQNLEMCDDKNTVLEELMMYHKSITQQEARGALGAFLFTANDIDKKIEVLSGGEKVRLQLCKILYSKPNLLILDEPTNHLDLIGKEQLESILESYQGTIVFVSHDRYFVKKIATDLIVFDTNNAIYYNMNYEEYMKKEYQEEVEEVKTKKIVKKNNSNFNEMKKSLKQLEKDIDKLEKQRDTLKNNLYNSDTFNDYEKANQINKKLESVEQRLNDLNKTWEEQAMLLEEKDC